MGSSLQGTQTVHRHNYTANERYRGSRIYRSWTGRGSCALKKIRRRKAPGVDGVLQKCSMKQAEQWTSAWFNYTTRACVWGTFRGDGRKSLRRSLTRGRTSQVLIPHHSDSYNFYRPWKMMERRMRHYKGHHRQQYGFTPSPSTEDAVHSLLNFTCNTNYKRCLAVFMDINGAFHSLCWPSILHSLQAAGCPKKSILPSPGPLLGERKVILRRYTRDVTPYKQQGWPQGSVLGPWEWNVVMTNLLWGILMSTQWHMLMVIDAESRAAVENKANVVLGRVTQWCNGKSLQSYWLKQN